MPARSILVPAAALVLALAGCRSGDGPGDSGPDSSLIPPQSTESEAAPEPSDTTAATAPASTAPTAPTAFTAEARDAVNELKSAWEAGDRARAAAIAPGDVVEALFVVPPDGYEVYGCDTGEFETSSCSFRNRASEAFISVSATRTDQGWQITTIDVNVD